MSLTNYLPKPRRRSLEKQEEQAVSTPILVKVKKEPFLNVDNEAAEFAQEFVKEHITAFRELAK
jgi:uncharacterized protein (DUF2164 family)